MFQVALSIIVGLLTAITYRPAFSENKAYVEWFGSDLVLVKEHKQTEHPWIQRAIGNGFREQFALSHLPFRAWARANSNSDYLAHSQSNAINHRLIDSNSDPESTNRRGHAQSDSDTKRLIVMIESDGASWRSAGYQAPSDPTPKEPVSLQMALVTPNIDHVLYLARPCQFIGSTNTFFDACKDKRWWTSWRFAPQVVDAYKNVILEYLSKQNNHRLVLVGFSGGGSLAAQIAVQLKQTNVFANICLITIASPLDLNAWAKHHRLSLFNDLPDVELLKQTFLNLPAGFAFSDVDRKVPIQSAGELLNEPALTRKVHRYSNLYHKADWVEFWPNLLMKVC